MHAKADQLAARESSKPNLEGIRASRVRVLHASRGLTNWEYIHSRRVPPGCPCAQSGLAVPVLTIGSRWAH